MTRRARENAFWGLVEFAAPALAALVFTPLVFRQLGYDGYGHYALLVAIAALGNLAGLGLTITATRHVAEFLIAGSEAKLAGFLGACSALLVVAIAAGAACLAAGVPLVAGLGLWQPGAGLDPMLVGLSAATLFAAQSFDAFASACLKGTERFRTLSTIDLAARPAAAAALWLASLASGRPETCVFVQSAAIASFAVLKTARFAQGLGPIRIAPGFDRAALRSVLAYSRWPWLQSVGGVLFNSVDRLIVGAVLGSAALAVYTIAVQLGQMVHNLAIAVFQQLLPAASRLSAQGLDRALAALARRANVLALAVSVAMAAAIVVLTGPFLALWMGQDFAAKHAAEVAWLLLGYAALSANVAAYYLLAAVGRIREAALVNVIAGLLMLASLPWLAQRYELPGTALARAVYAVVALLQVLIALRELRGPSPSPCPPAAPAS